jgi:hypothetical protein
LARLQLGARPAGPALARLGDAPRAVRRFPPLRGKRRPAGRGAVGDVGTFSGITREPDCYSAPAASAAALAGAPS